MADRSTPYQATGATPAELMFKRKIRTKLPELSSVNKSEVNESIPDRDQIRKEAGKQYGDEKRHAKETEVAVGDEVLLQQKKHDKLKTAFEPEPCKVFEKLGSQVLIQSPAGVRYKRNVAHTKKYIREQTDQHIAEPTAPSAETLPGQTAKNSDTEHTDKLGNPTQSPAVRKSDRLRKPAEKFKDYIVWHVQITRSLHVISCQSS